MNAVTMDDKDRPAGSESRVGRKAKDNAKERFHVALTPKLMERLDAIREKTDAASYTEVFKNALKLYDMLINEAEKGNEFFVRDESGKERVYSVFIGL